MDLEEGILTKLRLERQQQLMTMLADKCYKNNDYTFLQAERCERFYTENDFKLNLLGSFVREHTLPHLQQHEKCYSGAAFESLATNEEKDRAFEACHSKWLSTLKSEVAFDLELKARQLFQSQQQ